MIGVQVQIVRYTDDSQPGWVECHLAATNSPSRPALPPSALRPLERAAAFRTGTAFSLPTVTAG